MTTYKRICIDDWQEEVEGHTLKLERAKEYTTSVEEDGEVTVFTGGIWFSAPVKLFTAEKLFTGRGE